MSRRTLPLRMYRLLATEEMRFMLSRTTLRGLRMLRSGGNSVCVQGQSALALPSITPLQDHVVCTCSNRLVLPAASPAVQALYYSSPTHKPSSTQRIKVVLKEYGGVAVVFHTVMSLASLGTCYLIVSSGVDVGKVLEYFNVQSSAASKGASTFAVAYVLHKMLLPFRAGITVAGVPLIVRWLRTRGWIRGVVKQVETK